MKLSFDEIFDTWDNPGKISFTEHQRILKGKEYTEERRHNMSLAGAGKPKKPFTELHKLNMSIGNKGRKRNPLTYIHKQRIGIKMIGNKWNIGKKSRQIGVTMIKNGVVVNKFESVMDAAIFLNLSAGSISNRLTGKIKKKKDYELKYTKNIEANAL